MFTTKYFYLTIYKVGEHPENFLHINNKLKRYTHSIVYYLYIKYLTQYIKSFIFAQDNVIEVIVNPISSTEYYTFLKDKMPTIEENKCIYKQELQETTRVSTKHYIQ